MATAQLERKPCKLVEFCGDFHIAGMQLCEGIKNSEACPLYIRIRKEDSSGIYSGGPLRR